MATGGIDKFDRAEIAFDPPPEPLVVDSRRSGVRGLEDVERDEGKADASLADLAGRMNAPGRREAEVDEAERGREEVTATIERATTAHAPSPSPPDAPAQPEDHQEATDGQESAREAQAALAGPPREENGAEAVIEGTKAEMIDTSTSGDSSTIQATLAEVVQPSPSIEEIASQTVYVPDIEDDERRCASDERRCVEKASDGRRCRSYAMRGQTACAGHSGIGLAASPTEHAALAHESRRHLKLQRQLVAPGGKWGPRAATKLEVMRRGAALARHAVDQALAAEGLPAVQSVVKLLDATDPLVTVEATTSVDSVLQKLQAGEDPTYMELAAVFGPGGALSPTAGDALPAETG